MTNFKAPEYPVSVEEMCARYRKLYTGAVGDILDHRGYRSQILPHYINSMTGDYVVAGPAFTGYGEGHDDITEDDSATRIEMLSDVTPHSVSVWQTNGHEGAAHWGEIMSNAVMQRGSTGAILDGGLRDIKYVKELDFPVFCRFSCSASSVGRWSIRSYQQPIKIGVTDIRPYDFVIADSDGVVIVPKELAYEVLIEAEAFMENESKMRESLKNGKTVKAVYEEFGSF